MLQVFLEHLILDAPCTRWGTDYVMLKILKLGKNEPLFLKLRKQKQTEKYCSIFFSILIAVEHIYKTKQLSQNTTNSCQMPLALVLRKQKVNNVKTQCLTKCLVNLENKRPLRYLNYTRYSIMLSKEPKRNIEGREEYKRHISYVNNNFVSNKINTHGNSHFLREKESSTRNVCCIPSTEKHNTDTLHTEFG